MVRNLRLVTSYTPSRGAVAGFQDFAEDSPEIKVAPRLVAAKGGRIQGGRAMGTKSQGGA